MSIVALVNEARSERRRKVRELVRRMLDLLLEYRPDICDEAIRWIKGGR